MFRTMRREKQLLTTKECVQILTRGTSGVLAVSGDDDYPYGVPLSYVYHDHKIYFHSAKSGHKLDAIARNPKASFCVIDQDQIVPQEYTSYFRSVIAFGTARVLEDDAEKKRALELLAVRYSPDQEQERLQQEVAKSLGSVAMIELTIEHLSGKEAKELAKKKRFSSQ